MCSPPDWTAPEDAEEAEAEERERRIADKEKDEAEVLNYVREARRATGFHSSPRREGRPREQR